MLQGLETDAWSKQGDELGFTGKSTHFLPAAAVLQRWSGRFSVRVKFARLPVGEL